MFNEEKDQSEIKVNYELKNLTKMNNTIRDLNIMLSIFRVKYEKTKKESDKKQLFEQIKDVKNALERYEKMLKQYIKDREEEIKNLDSSEFIKTIVKQ